MFYFTLFYIYIYNFYLCFFLTSTYMYKIIQKIINSLRKKRLKNYLMVMSIDGIFCKLEGELRNFIQRE